MNIDSNLYRARNILDYLNINREWLETRPRKYMVQELKQRAQLLKDYLFFIHKVR